MNKILYLILTFSIISLIFGASNTITNNIYNLSVIGLPAGSTFSYRIAPNYTTINYPITNYITKIPIYISPTTNTTYHGKIPYQYMGAGTTETYNSVIYTMLPYTYTQILNTTNTLKNNIAFYLYLNTTKWLTGNQTQELKDVNSSINKTKIILSNLQQETQNKVYGSVIVNNTYLSAGQVYKNATYSFTKLNNLTLSNITFSNNKITKANNEACISTNLNQYQYCSNATTPDIISVPIINGHFGLTNLTYYPLNITFSSHILNNQLKYNYSVIDKTNNTILQPLTQITNGSIIIQKNYKINLNQSVEISFNVSGNNNYSKIIDDPITSPTNIIYYLPIQFTNYQSTALSANTQLAIGTTSNGNIIGFNALKYNTYESKNLNNTNFFYSNGTVITSWMEGNILNEFQNQNLYDSSNVLFWVKIGQNAPNFLPANTGTPTTNTIYMGFASNTINTFSNTTTGEAPQLTTIYAKYDDGFNTFKNYWNFNGTVIQGLGTQTTGGGWSTYCTNTGYCTENPSYLSQNNGLIITTLSSNYDFFWANTSIGTLNSSFSWFGKPPKITDNLYYNVSTTCSETGWGYGLGNQGADVGELPYFGTRCNTRTNFTNAVNGAPFGNFNWNTQPPNNGVYSAYIFKNNTNTYVLNSLNYTPQIGNIIAISATYNIGFGDGYYTNSSNYTIHWARLANTPPQNIQPTTSYGSITQGVSVTISPTIATIDNGQSITLTATATGGSSYTYQWYSGTSSTCSSDTTPLGTSSTQTVSPTTTTYYCVEVDSGIYSTTTQIIVNPALSTPTLTSTPTLSATLDAGQYITFNSSWSGGTSTYSANYIITNTITDSVVYYNKTSGLSSTSSSLKWQIPYSLTGSTLEANVIITDSASTPTTTNSVYIKTLTVKSALLTCPSANDTACYPIYINNNQNSATGNDFQQMINLTESSFSALKYTPTNTFANFMYTYSNGTVIPAWIESNTSGKIITWLNISKGLNANSNTLIYLNIKHSNQLNASGLNGIGEAPQLTSTYAQYDDGARVFNNYWNFAGTTLPSGWTIENPAYETASVNNGIFINTTQTSQAFYYSSPLTFPLIYSFYGETVNSLGGTSRLLNMITPVIGLYPIYFGLASGGGFRGTGIETSAGTSFTWTVNTPYLFTGSYGLASQNMQINYITMTTQSYSITPPFYILEWQDTANNFFYWIRTSEYPPNGVMPSYTFGSSVTPSTATPTSIDNRQKVTSIVANWQGGTAPYTLKLYYTPSTYTSCFYDGIPLASATTSSTTYTFSNYAPLSTGYYCVGITDSSTIPQNAVTASNTITFYQRPEITSGYNITIDNTQSTATGTNFQQLIGINTLQLNGANTNGNNIEFAYNGNVLNSWMENNAVSSNVLYWVQVPNVPATSNLIIQAIIAPTSNNLYNAQTTGTAPQLTGSYGLYDSGTFIFPFYDGFKGNLLNKEWNYYTTFNNANQYLKPNNGLISQTYGGSSQYLWTTNVENGDIIEGDVNSYSTSGGSYQQYFIFANTISSIGVASGGRYGSSISLGSSNNNNGITNSYIININSGSTITSGSALSQNTPFIYGFDWTYGSQKILFNYTSILSSTDSTFTKVSSPIELKINGDSGTNNYFDISWIRTRNNPPNGVMPSTTQNTIPFDGFYYSNNDITTGSTQTLTAKIVGGASPYTYNFLIYNSIGLVTNALYTNVASTSNSFSFTQNTTWGIGNFMANVIITDSNNEFTTNSINYTTKSALNAIVYNAINETYNNTLKFKINVTAGTSPFSGNLIVLSGLTQELKTQFTSTSGNSLINMSLITPLKTGSYTIKLNLTDNTSANFITTNTFSINKAIPKLIQNITTSQKSFPETNGQIITYANFTYGQFYDYLNIYSYNRQLTGNLYLFIVNKTNSSKLYYLNGTPVNNLITEPINYSFKFKSLPSYTLNYNKYLFLVNTTGNLNYTSANTLTYLTIYQSSTGGGGGGKFIPPSSIPTTTTLVNQTNINQTSILDELYGINLGILSLITIPIWIIFILILLIILILLRRKKKQQRHTLLNKQTTKIDKFMVIIEILILIIILVGVFYYILPLLI